MKKLSFYWNWLARVAKASNTQHNVAMKTTTTKSKTNEKTAILAVATIIAVALTTQTTKPTAQSAEMPTLPDLPDPGPVPEPAFPPVPPGTFTCSEYYNAVRPMLDDQNANLKKAIERTYNAKRKPFDDYIAARIVMIKWYREQLKKVQDEWQRLFYAPGGPIINRKRLQDLNGLTTFYTEAIKEEVERIRKAYEELGKIESWYRKMLDWARKKYEKAVEALDAQYQDCLDSESDDN